MPDDQIANALGDGGTVAPVPDEGTGAVASPGEGSAAAPDAAETERIKWLESMDPAKLPESVRRKLELPFQQHFTRKYQELSDERSKTLSVLDTISQRLAQTGAAATPDQRAALVERIQSGDLAAVDQLVEKIVSDRVAPIQQDQALRNAVETAKSLHPYVVSKEQEIAQILNSDPQLKAMSQANNFQFAPQVLAGLALQIENAELKAKLTGVNVDKIKAEAVEEFKKKSAGLPATTTRAGSSPSAPRGNGAAPAKTVQDAGLQAWVQMGNSPDTYR